MDELSLVNSASALFESASGCRLHRDPTSLKCKVLLLGKWRTKLQQKDLPADCQYFVVSDHLDMVGVELRATWVQTRKSNGDIIQSRVANTINSWRGGKFMDLTHHNAALVSERLCSIQGMVWKGILTPSIVL